MGHAAFAAADHIVITSDNPRSEDPEKIIAMILAGIPSTTSKSGSTILSITDRAAAILAAVRNAQINDVILVAGKGHESSQEIRGKRVEFSDQAHIQLALGDRA
jgi:UDP-N-acetylmuramoyl-L-alanyl-D-glutamate--2,6-diaminopimelate ligase